MAESKEHRAERLADERSDRAAEDRAEAARLAGEKRDALSAPAAEVRGGLRPEDLPREVPSEIVEKPVLTLLEAAEAAIKVEATTDDFIHLREAVERERVKRPFAR